jgi:hypothetical protein
LSIEATVKALGNGLIAPGEMPIDPKTNINTIRYAPPYSVGPSVTAGVTHPYTIESMAKFLGFVKSGSQTPRDSFVAAFGALELISEGLISESRVRDLEIRKLGEVVAAVKRQRDAAFAESKRLAAEATKQAEEAKRREQQALKEKAEAEERQG